MRTLNYWLVRTMLYFGSLLAVAGSATWAQQPSDPHLWGSIVPQARGELEVTIRHQRLLDSSFTEGAAFVFTPFYKPLGLFMQARANGEFIDINTGIALVSIDRDSSQGEAGIGGGTSIVRYDGRADSLHSFSRSDCGDNRLPPSDFCTRFRTDPSLFTYGRYKARDFLMDGQFRVSFLNNATFYPGSFDYNNGTLRGNYWYTARIMFAVKGVLGLHSVIGNGLSAGVMSERRFGEGFRLQVDADYVTAWGAIAWDSNETIKANQRKLMAAVGVAF